MAMGSGKNPKNGEIVYWEAPKRLRSWLLKQSHERVLTVDEILTEIVGNAMAGNKKTPLGGARPRVRERDLATPDGSMREEPVGIALPTRIAKRVRKDAKAPEVGRGAVKKKIAKPAGKTVAKAKPASKAKIVAKKPVKKTAPKPAAAVKAKKRA